MWGSKHTYQRLAEVDDILDNFVEDNLLMLHNKFALKEDRDADRGSCRLSDD